MIHIDRRYTDSMMTTIVVASAVFVTVSFLWILGDVLWNGLSGLSLAFLTEAPESSGRAGGITPILVSTALILGVCMIVSLPIGLGTAILLAELTSADGPLGRWVGRSLDVLAAIPSIVFGLFGNALFCNLLGLGFSILSGGLTLACMVLPILIRATEAGFRSVPEEYRLGGAALGLSRTSILFRLLLPLAAPGLVVGTVLGIGRAIAETAALIFTSGYVDRLPSSLMDSGRTLSIHIYDLSMNVPGGNTNAYATAIVLVILLILINQVTTWLSAYYLRRGIMTL